MLLDDSAGLDDPTASTGDYGSSYQPHVNRGPRKRMSDAAKEKANTARRLSIEFSKKAKRNKLFAKLEAIAIENETLRKPCSHPTCSTLVKPELLQQHFAAYHPTVPFTH